MDVEESKAIPRSRSSTIGSVSKMVTTFKRKSGFVKRRTSTQMKLSRKERKTIKRMLNSILDYILGEEDKYDMVETLFTGVEESPSEETLSLSKSIAEMIVNTKDLNQDQFFAFLAKYSLDNICLVVKASLQMKKKPLIPLETAMRLVDTIKIHSGQISNHDIALKLRACLLDVEDSTFETLSKLFAALNGTKNQQKLASTFAPILMLTRENLGEKSRSMDKNKISNYVQLIGDTIEMNQAMEILITLNATVFGQASFVTHKITNDNSLIDGMEEKEGEGLFKAVAKFPFQQEQKDELTLKQGDIITVLQQHNDGWWLGKNERNEQGIFPGNYVEEQCDDKTAGTNKSDVTTPNEINHHEQSTSRPPSLGLFPKETSTNSEMHDAFGVEDVEVSIEDLKSQLEQRDKTISDLRLELAAKEKKIEELMNQGKN